MQKSAPFAGRRVSRREKKATVCQQFFRAAVVARDPTSIVAPGPVFGYLTAPMTVAQRN